MDNISPRMPTTTQPVHIVLLILMWIAWLGVLVIADFLAFMMFAFADSPSSGQAAKIMIVPVFIWFGVTFVAGVLLLIFRGWWQIPLAFGLAISPPFLVFLGYNLLSGASRATPTMPTQPTTTVQVRPGGFVPPPTTVPTQPDFQKLMRNAATSRPKSD